MSRRHSCSHCGSYSEVIGRCAECGEEVCYSCGGEAQFSKQRRGLEDRSLDLGIYIVHKGMCERRLARRLR